MWLPRIVLEGVRVHDPAFLPPILERGSWDDTMATIGADERRWG